ncbi:unnamed protein product, partial [Amoebophrya sp. A120]
NLEWAVFYDCENQQPNSVDQVHDHIRSLGGRILLQRAYGDFHTHGMLSWRVACERSGVALVQKSPFNSRAKNAADMALAIDATELPFTHPSIQAFAIVTADGDFLPLTCRLREHGRIVHVCAAGNASKELQNRGCDYFLPLRRSNSPPAGASVKSQTNASTVAAALAGGNFPAAWQKGLGIADSAAVVAGSMKRRAENEGAEGYRSNLLRPGSYGLHTKERNDDKSAAAGSSSSSGSGSTSSSRDNNQATTSDHPEAKRRRTGATHHASAVASASDHEPTSPSSVRSNTSCSLSEDSDDSSFNNFHQEQGPPRAHFNNPGLATSTTSTSRPSMALEVLLLEVLPVSGQWLNWPNVVGVLRKKVKLHIHYTAFHNLLRQHGIADPSRNAITTEEKGKQNADAWKNLLENAKPRGMKIEFEEVLASGRPGRRVAHVRRVEWTWPGERHDELQQRLAGADSSSSSPPVRPVLPQAVSSESISNHHLTSSLGSVY